MKMIKIKKIRLGLRYKVTSSREMKAMEKSIRENGLINPIIVEETGWGYYRLIDGYYRLMVYKKIGLHEIPCVVKQEVKPEEVRDD